MFDHIGLSNTRNLSETVQEFHEKQQTLNYWICQHFLGHFEAFPNYKLCLFLNESLLDKELFFCLTALTF